MAGVRNHDEAMSAPAIAMPIAILVRRSSRPAKIPDDASACRAQGYHSGVERHRYNLATIHRHDDL